MLTYFINHQQTYFYWFSCFTNLNILTEQSVTFWSYYINKMTTILTQINQFSQHFLELNQSEMYQYYIYSLHINEIKSAFEAE